MKKINGFLNVADTKYRIAVWLFLIATLISGVFTIMMREPMTWLDEYTHYARAIELARGDMFVSPNQDVSQMGGYITTGQKQFIDESVANRSLENKKRQSTVSLDWFDYYNTIPYGTEVGFYANTNTVPYTPTSYIPYILVAGANQLVKANPIVEYTWMRIFGFVSSFLLVLLAVKVAPFGKLTLAMLASSPTVVASFSAVTADGFNIAVSMLFVAYVVKVFYKLAQKTELTRRDMFGLIGLMVLVSIAKMPTFFLLGLIVPMLWTPTLKKEQKKHIVLAFMVSAVVIIGWLYLVRHINTGAFWGRKVSTVDQLMHVLSDIPKFIFVFLMTLSRHDFLNLQLGYTNTPLYLSIPTFVSLSYYIAVMASVLIKDSHYTQTISFNAYTARFNMIKYGLFVFISCAIFGILYLQFSEVGSLSIDGVQPRYFIPFFPLVFLQSAKVDLPNRFLGVLIVLVGLLPTVTHMIMLIMQYFRVM